MRKIEKEMIEAIQNEKNWSKDNTQVSNNKIICVYLHGSLIAEIGNNELRLFDAGYQTKTTKSRLNAILNHFNLPTISAKKFEWYIGTEIWNGSTSYQLKSTKGEIEPTIYTIPACFLSLIFNGDASGLEDDDIKAWQQFQQQMITDGFTNGHWSYPDNQESWLCSYNDVTRLGADVVHIEWVDMSK
jgi:hypothetical protein